MELCVLRMYVGTVHCYGSPGEIALNYLLVFITELELPDLPPQFQNTNHLTILRQDWHTEYEGYVRVCTLQAT